MCDMSSRTKISSEIADSTIVCADIIQQILSPDCPEEAVSVDMVGDIWYKSCSWSLKGTDVLVVADS